MRALSLLKERGGDLVVLVIAGCAIAEALISKYGEPPVLFAFLSLTWTLPLFLRRLLPLAAPLGVVALFAFQTFAYDKDSGPVTSIAAVVFATFWVGLNHDRRRALAGLALAFALVQIVNRTIGDFGAYDIIFTAVVIGIPWLGGRLLRTRDERLSALAEHAERLEREREERARAAVAEERARIARELHDVVGHSISVMTIQAGAARLLIDGAEPERADEPLHAVEQTGRQTLVEMRRLLGILGDRTGAPVVEPQPGLRRLDHLVANVRRAGLPVDLVVDGPIAGLPPGVDLTAYRIVQEALTNALRYARGASARVQVRSSPESLELEIESAGIRGDGAVQGGHGLVGMRERVALFGGTLEAGPSGPAGYRVRARLPVGADG
jgi:signal transduction histidine kinase